MTLASKARPQACDTLPHGLMEKALLACQAAMAVCDMRLPGRPFVFANAAFCSLTGYTADEVLGRDCDFLHGPHTEPQSRADIRRAMESGEPLTTVLRSHRRDGSAFWNRLCLSPVHDECGAVTHYVAMLDDAGERLARDHSLELLLRAHGAAAGSGRSVIVHRIDEALADHRITGRNHSLLELRVQVHTDGEPMEALRQEGVSVAVAMHVRSLLPSRATMACLEALRFAVVMPLTAASEDAETVATRVIAELPTRLEFGAHLVLVSASAGIALLPQDGQDALGLLEAAADAAARGAGRPEKPLQYASPRHEGRWTQRVFVSELKAALEQGHLRLVFLPQIRLSTGNVVGFEALLRWQHPVHGALSPAEFIPLVESCGMADTVTRWVMERGVAQLRAWEDMGHQGLQLAVNASPGVFESPDIDQFVFDLLKRYEVAGNQIEIELKERAFSDAHPGVVERLQALRGRGICVAMDDFGTGYSSLGSLTRLPLDSLKLDVSFAQGAVSNPSHAMVARLTCKLARALKLRLVVEGIETEGQLEFFSRQRCDLAQGYFFAKPLEAADATALLQSGRNFQPQAKPRQGERHMLLLDDEPNILRSLRRVFRAQPWTVHTANTPDEAFELLARHPIGVVMSDQRMPLMRGTDFLARVKQLYPDTVRIVLSGYTELQSVTEAINQGAIYKFLTKPWNDQQLTEEMEQAFRQHEMVAESQWLQQQLLESNKSLETRLKHNVERLQREQAALDVTHEALGVVPVPILGIDVSGMIAISNAAADALLGAGASVVGEHVSDVLPAELADSLQGGDVPGPRTLHIGHESYLVRCSHLGATSRGTGTVITLLQKGTP